MRARQIHIIRFLLFPIAGTVNPKSYQSVSAHRYLRGMDLCCAPVENALKYLCKV